MDSEVPWTTGDRASAAAHIAPSPLDKLRLPTLPTAPAMRHMVKFPAQPLLGWERHLSSAPESLATRSGGGA